METYVKPILNNDTPVALILHIGCNDIGNKQLTENEIAEWIRRGGLQGKEGNINEKVIVVKRVCKLNKLGFIDNSNISTENLFEDSLHLSDDGKVILANNFICVLIRFIL